MQRDKPHDQSLREWLASIQLEHCAELLEHNDVDLHVLTELNELDLERLGFSLGHRKRLLRAIADRSSARLLQAVTVHLPCDEMHGAGSSP
jgi:hypothetical protein